MVHSRNPNAEHAKPVPSKAQLVPALIGKAGELVRPDVQTCTYTLSDFWQLSCLLERSIQDRTGAKIDISRDSIPGKDGLRTPEHNARPSHRSLFAEEDGVHRTIAQHLFGPHADDAAAAGEPRRASAVP